MAVNSKINSIERMGYNDVKTLELQSNNYSI